MIEVGFPNTIKYSGTATGDEVVSVEIVDKEDDTLKGTHLLVDTGTDYRYSTGVEV